MRIDPLPLYWHTNNAMGDAQVTTQLLKNLIGSYIRNGWLPATLNSEINHATTDQYVLFLLRDQLQSVLEIVQTLRQYLSEDSNEERYSPKARIGTIAVHLATIERLAQGSLVLTDSPPTPAPPTRRPSSPSSASRPSCGSTAPTRGGSCSSSMPAAAASCR